MSTATEAWLLQLENIQTNGDEVNTRGMETRELLNQTISMDMNYPIIYHKHRDINYKFMAADAEFIANGDNRVSSLTRYNKNVAQFSDDGLIFNGNYGDPFNSQLEYVVRSLVDFKESRQAVLTIWCENPVDSKDIRCLSGDTILNSPEGDVSIKELSAKFVDNEIDKYPVYSFNEDKKQIQLDWITKSWSTGNKDLIRLVTRDGREIKCTPDHKILIKRVVRHGNSRKVIFKFIEAQYIFEGDEIASTHFIYSKNNPRKHISKLTGNWSYKNQKSEQEIYAKFLYPDAKNYIVHHKDKNRENNSKSNIELMSQYEHNSLHMSEKTLVAKYFSHRNLRIDCTNYAKGNRVIRDSSDIKYLLNDCLLSFDQLNWRVEGSRTWQLYEKYKSVSNLLEFLSVGYWAELKQDILRGSASVLFSEDNYLMIDVMKEVDKLKSKQFKEVNRDEERNFGKKPIIESIEYIGEEETFDFTTENNHNACVNGGMIVHNCTLSIQFLIRDGHINTIVNMRSSDIVWGIGYDLFNFTIMTLKVLTRYHESLGIDNTSDKDLVRLGDLYLNAGSSHLYKRHYNFAEQILANTTDEKVIAVPDKALVSWNYIVHSLVACKDELSTDGLWNINPLNY